MNQLIKHVVAAAAAVAITVTLFSGVVSLADNNQAMMLAARINPTIVAAHSVSVEP